ncbi:glycoside hydrolase family 26 protein [Candidatus Frankia alpina]|uniref:glycoside hydrolase family 26 protein n=1 Tax=Candidatus Frankia alpina TaxID=2699483 RepID=UPI00301354EA
MSGVSAGSMTQVRAWESFRGSPVNAVLTFSDRSSWQTMTSPWVGSGPEKFSTFNGTWIISQPFFPTGGGDMNSCASGAYSSHWADFGRWLVNKGRPASIIRLAWEFNGNWFPWSVSKTSATTWVSCFRQVVGAIRSTDPQARIDWALNAHSGGAWSVYPGDQYLDIIGVDSYDQWPASTTDAAFATQRAEATGLCSVIAFARQHGKQFSVPEWGLVGKSDTGAGRAGRRRQPRLRPQHVPDVGREPGRPRLRDVLQQLRGQQRALVPAQPEREPERRRRLRLAVVNRVAARRGDPTAGRAGAVTAGSAPPAVPIAASRR